MRVAGESAQIRVRPPANEAEGLLLPPPPSGISTLSSPRVQRLPVEDARHLPSPPVSLRSPLTGEGPNPPSCALKRRPGQKAARRRHSQLLSRAVEATPGSRRKKSLKVALFSRRALV